MATAVKFVNEKGKWVIEKDPNATLDYVWPWEDWLAEVSDTIVSAIVAEAVGVTTSTVAVNPTNVVVWVSGGTPSNSQLASVTVRITTVGGRVDDRTAYFRIKQK